MARRLPSHRLSPAYGNGLGRRPMEKPPCRVQGVCPWPGAGGGAPCEQGGCRHRSATRRSALTTPRNFAQSAVSAPTAAAGGFVQPGIAKRQRASGLPRRFVPGFDGSSSTANQADPWEERLLSFLAVLAFLTHGYTFDLLRAILSVGGKS